LILRVVVDTNVLVSGLLSADGSPARVVGLVRDAHVTLLLDDRILLEYRTVLARPKFQRAIKPAQAEALLALCSELGEYVAARPLNVAQPDPDDAPFLEVAVAGRAHALVTGNLKHFPPTPGLRILGPAAFLTYYELIGQSLED
jgi:putative PIN family toxin of toxin-antitoxin system